MAKKKKTKTLNGRVIDPALKRCSGKMGDKPYANCVKKIVRTYPALQVSDTPIVKGFVSKGATLVTEDITGGTIEGSGLRKPRQMCQPSERKNPIGPCRVELDFPSPEDIAKHNLPPGTPAVIRKCDKKGSPGHLVPVSDLDEALEVSKDFCNCVKGKTSRRAKCARHG